MPTVPGAILPALPFPFEIPVPETHPSDEPTVQVCFNIDWLPYIMGALGALLADSTWNTSNPTTLDSVKNDVQDLLSLFAQAEACEVLVFRVNPSDPANWQYSTDGGTTWIDGPDTAANYTASFTADSDAPGGYDITINDGTAATDIPLLTATDVNAIVKNPASLLANLITASAGADGLAIQALAQVGVWLVKNNGVAAAFNKIPGLGLATSVLEIVAGTDYSYPLLETVSSP
jgi:hypothetical protein